MKKELIRNRFIIVSKVLLVPAILILVYLGCMASVSGNEDIEISGIPGIIMIGIAVLTACVYGAMFIMEMILSIKEHGGVSVIGSMIAQLIICFVVVLILGKYIFKSGESVQYYLFFACAIVLTNRSIDYWKRYHKIKEK